MNSMWIQSSATQIFGKANGAVANKNILGRVPLTTHDSRLAMLDSVYKYNLKYLYYPYIRRT